MVVSMLFVNTASTEMLNGTVLCNLLFLPSLSPCLPVPLPPCPVCNP